MPDFKTTVVLSSAEGKPLKGPHISTHYASSAQRAREIAREEACSDWGHPFERINDVVVLMCIKLDRPTRNQILNEMAGNYVPVTAAGAV